MIWRRWPTLVQEMGTMPCSQDLADELGASVKAVQQARMASEGYSALSIDAAYIRLDSYAQFMAAPLVGTAGTGSVRLSANTATAIATTTTPTMR